MTQQETPKRFMSSIPYTKTQTAKMYFSGHMERFDNNEENKIKTQTFHLYVKGNTSAFEYESAETREHRDFTTIMKLQEKNKKLAEENKALRNYICDLVPNVKN